MALETFTKQKNAEAKPKVEEDFIITAKGNKFPIGISPKRDSIGRCFVSSGLTRGQRIMKQFPKVDRWLRTRYNSRRTWEVYANYLIDFCIANDITPKEFAELRHSEKEQDKAIDLASEHIQDFLFKKKYNQAKQSIKALKSFYEFHSKGRKILALDIKGSLKIKIEDARSKERPRYAWGSSKEVRRKMMLIIPSMRDLFDRMALTFLFRTGCRRNVLHHLKIKHVQDRFELENPIIHKKEEVLCLTITGYNQETKQGICEKTEHYNFPTMLDDPKQRHGYYTFLARDSLELFDKFLKKYHPTPKPDDYVFYRLSDKTKPLGITALLGRFRTTLRRLDFPSKKIWLHQFKELFTTLAEAALSKEESYHVEFLSGHILGESKEHYHKRNKIADGEAYLKIDFGGSITEKEDEIERLRKEQEQLREEKQKLLDAMEKAKVTTKVEIEPMPTLGSPHDMSAETKEYYKIHPASPELNAAFNEFNDVLRMREKYEKDIQQPTEPEAASIKVTELTHEEYEKTFQTQVPKSEPNRPTKPIQKAETSVETLEKDDLIGCPYNDDWVTKADCERCKATQFNVWSDCYNERSKNPNNPIFKPSKPRPQIL